MELQLSQLVWDRARSSCEYCQLNQANSLITFEIDHVIAKKHGGQTVAENLCLSCFYCNSFKGTNIAGIDPLTENIVQLFNPRRHHWKRFFRWAGARLIGQTPIGRATVNVLCINNPATVALRRSLIDEGDFPPK